MSSFQKEIYKTGSSHEKRDVSKIGVSVVTAVQGRISLVQTLRSETTISSLLIQKTNPSDSGTYECIPSNTGPAKINVHVLDGKYENRCFFHITVPELVCYHKLLMK